MKFRFNYTVYFLVLAAIIFQSCKNQSSKVQIIAEMYDKLGPSQHGLTKLDQALDSLGITVNITTDTSELQGGYYIFAGLSSDANKASQMLEDMKIALPKEKEALLIKKTTYKDKPALILCGGDEVGLMYAYLDVAKRISWSQNPENLFEFVSEVSEVPDVKERGVSMGTFHRGYFEQRLHDMKYWEAYFDMMAESRLNQFLMIFGYKNNQMREPNFMAPAYPNFFDVEGYPNVKIKNVTKAQQKQNTRSLKKIIDMAHARGIEFGVGLWDQIERDPRYKAMVSADGDIPPDLPDNIIWGLTQENLIPYTKLAMRKFFKDFPEIDLVQFRMHWEAGISGDVALQFWKEIFTMLKEESPNIKIEARAKDVPDETLYDGVDTGADFRVATKHWMEQMGMPFHPTHINKDNQFDRRHGYADMLRYPKKYGFKWRVWSGGTTRLFLWGDPDWVKTFAEGSHLYDAVGFEFNEPLYFKMNGSKHDAEVTGILNPDKQYYSYEFERYWHYYQVMGRVAYNPQTTPDIWEMEFEKRFGKEAGQALMNGLHKASKVLPRIVTASYLYPRFASPQGWPELQRMEDLEHFALHSKPSDIVQFASPQEEAELILKKKPSFRILPSQTSTWFSNISTDILNAVEKADKTIGPYRNNEYVSTVTDLRMLAYLAQYHSQRLLAAIHYNLYLKTGNLVAFDNAISFESNAVDAYGKMAESAGDVYNQQLDFGSNINLFPGHWNKEYYRLLDELKDLRNARAQVNHSNTTKDLTIASLQIQASADDEPPIVELQRIENAPLEKPLKIKASVSDASGVKSVTLRYRHVNQFEDYRSMEMVKTDTLDTYEAVIPAQFLDGKYDVMYFLEVMDTVGNGKVYPDLELEIPYVIVPLER